MTKRIGSSPFVYTDDGAKALSVANPDGSNSDLAVNYTSVSAIPTGFVGTARVGRQVFVGDGVSISPVSASQGTIALQLINWKSALAKVQAGTANAKVLFYGDSTDSGMMASGVYFANNKPLAPTDAVAKLFAKQNINANVATHCGAGFPYNPNTLVSDFLAYDTRFTLGAGWVWSDAQGIGAYKLLNSTTTNAINFTPKNTDGTALSFDTIEVVVYQSTAFANFTIAVDGGAALVTSTQSTGTRFLKLTATTTLAGHTVNIAKTAGDIAKSLYVVSITCYDATKKQVIFYNGGWGGAQIADLNNPASQFEIDYLQPNLTIINCAINDRGTTSISAYKASLQAIITRCLVWGSVILRPGNLISGTQNAEYVLANYDLAIANNLPVIDINYRHVSWALANNYGYLSSDGVHLSQVGYQDVANSVFEIIKP